MNVQSLTEMLGAMEPGRSIRFDFGPNVGPLASWRGVYAELTLTHTDKPRTVAMVLDDLRAAPGKTFQGYKGGNYVMAADTPLWADDYGDCNYRGVLGVTLEDAVVVLVTADLSDYR